MNVPKGVKTWQLGYEKHLKHLDCALNEAQVDSLYATSPSSEDHIRSLRESVDASRSAHGVGLVHTLASSCDAKNEQLIVVRLQRLLSLGVNPDLASSYPRRPSHIAARNHLALFFKAIWLCRPETAAKDGQGKTPGDIATEELKVVSSNAFRS